MSQIIDIAPPTPREREYAPFQGKWQRTVVLLGVSGSGKSAVGRYLSDYAGVTFIDADAEVEKRLGMAVSRAVISSAEDFTVAQRQVTERVLSEVLSDPQRARVVALAPSPSIEKPVLELLKRAKDSGVLIVELAADVAEVSRRLGLNAPRSVALGAPRAMLTKMIAATRAAHEPVINVSVNTVGRTVSDIGQEILTSL